MSAESARPVSPSGKRCREDCDDSPPEPHSARASYYRSPRTGGSSLRLNSSTTPRGSSTDRHSALALTTTPVRDVSSDLMPPPAAAARRSAHEQLLDACEEGNLDAVLKSLGHPDISTHLNSNGIARGIRRVFDDKGVTLDWGHPE